MSWLTAEDWGDIRSAALSLLAGATFLLVCQVWQNLRNGKPVFEMKSLFEWAMGVTFVLAFFFVTPMMDVFERYGWSLWMLFLVPLLLVTPFLAIAQLQMSLARRKAVPNPGAAPFARTPLSREEMRVNFKLNAAIIGFGFFVVAPIVAFAFWDVPLSGVGLGLLFPYVLAALAALIYGLFGRWPGNINLRAEIEIDAPPQKVWDVIRFRPTTSWWKKIVRRVERLNEPDEVYRLYYYNDDTCSSCGLPRNPDSEGRSSVVHVQESVEPIFLKWSTYPENTDSETNKIMLLREDESFILEALPNGRTRVKSEDAAIRPKVWIAIILKLGDTPGEQLRALKGHVEGQSVDTVYDARARRLAETRHAALFCGCREDARIAELLA